MKKMRNIRVPIYKDLVSVATCKEHVTRNRYWKEFVVEENFRNLGFVTWDSDGRILIYVSPCKGEDRSATIAHECYHAAMRTLDRAGVEVSQKDGGGESASYLLTWYVEAVNKEIRRLES